MATITNRISGSGPWENVTSRVRAHVNRDTSPRFGDTRLEDRTWVAGQAIDSLTLPEASGGNGELRYSLALADGGELPASLEFNADSRKLSGRPDKPGEPMTLAYAVQDEDGDSDTLTFRAEVRTPRILLSRAVAHVFEDGGTDSWTVRLEGQPTADVTVAVEVAEEDAGLLTPSPSRLTFTTENWSAGQTVTVTGAPDDDLSDRVVRVTHTASGPAAYDGATVGTLVLLGDTDVASLDFTASVATVDEGARGKAALRLSHRPSAAVTVSIVGDHPYTASADPSELTFTTENWNIAQDIAIVTNRDDDAHTAQVMLTATASGAVGYIGKTASIRVTVRDLDTPGLAVSAPEVVVVEGSTGTFMVNLATFTLDDVSVAVASDTPDALSVSPSVLTFTIFDYYKAQTVTVTAAEDDDALDGVAKVTLSASGTSEYAGRTASVSVAVTDKDAAKLVPSQKTLTVVEGASATMTLRLSAEPSADVTVMLASSGSAASVSPSSLTFTAANWSVAQTVTVAGAEDDDATDGTATVTFSASGATEYAGKTASLSVAVADDETSALVPSRQTLTVAEGARATMTLRLSAEPSADVAVTLTSSGFAASVSPSSLSFTQSNWALPQTVTVAGVEDDDAIDGTATVAFSASGAADYAGKTASISVAVEDDETAALVPSQETLTVAEGASATVTLRLSAKPSADVAVTFTGSGSAASVSPASFTFTPTDWSVARTVTVAGVEDDDSIDGTTTMAFRASGAADYAGKTASISVAVTDNDAAELALSAAGLAVDEGATATFGVSLRSRPSASVVVALASSDLTVATVSPASLSFTPTNWSMPQTAIVSGVEDGDDTERSARIALWASGAAEYSSATAGIAVSVRDSGGARPVASPLCVTSMSRHKPAQSPTNADSLTWRVTFNRPAQGIAGGEFAVSGAEAAIAARRIPDSDAQSWDVTATGDDLVDLDGEVVLDFLGQRSDDCADMEGEDGRRYLLDNSSPAATIAVAPVDVGHVVTLVFSEAVTGLEVDDIAVERGRLSGFSGSGARYTARLLSAGGDATVQVPAGVAVDLAGNGNLASAQIALATGAKPTADRKPLRRTLGTLASAMLTGAMNTVDAAGLDASPAAGMRLSLAGIDLKASPDEPAALPHPWRVNRTDAHHGAARLDSDDLLRGAAFRAPLAKAAQEADAGWTFWGATDIAAVEHDGADNRHDGAVRSGWFGADLRIDDRMSAGIALAHHQGRLDYAFRENAGKLRARLTAAYPHARARFGRAGDVWMMFGAGRGTLRQDPVRDVSEQASLVMGLAAAGLRLSIIQDADIALQFHTDAGFLELQANGRAGETGIGSLEARTWRGRAGLEARAGGWSVGESGQAVYPVGALLMRRDSGHGPTGNGFEMSVGLTFADPASRFGLDVEGRWLEFGGEERYREWGAGMRAELAPASGGRGWSLSVGLERGATVGGDLWSNDAPDSIRDAGATPAEAALSFRSAYGFASPSGLISPFAELAMTEDRRDYEAGVMLALHDNAVLSVRATLAAGVRRDGARRGERRIVSRLRLRF